MTKTPEIDEKTAEFLRQNMPDLEELAPEEYGELMGVYERIQEKYTQRASELLRERRLTAAVEEPPPEVAVSPYAAGGIAVVVLAAQVADKATGGEKAKSSQKAG
jgi:hypothetical protein